MLAGLSLHGTTNCRTGERNNSQSDLATDAGTPMNSIPASQSGTPLRQTAHSASTASRLSAQTSPREGRHSSRQGADIGNECGVGDIRASLVTHEPAPQLIVFAIQQL